MQIGFTETELRHMTFGKWAELFQCYQNAHDFTLRQTAFEDKKDTTVHSIKELARWD